MTRVLDFFFALAGLIFGLPILLVIWFVGWIETGSPIFKQVRVGRHGEPFVLLKFRTMRRGTPSVATHLADAADITKLGHFLRSTKLDELPQLWNVLKGEMSLVGPRPCLYSQTKLIEERLTRGVFAARPGITGLAQINGLDMSTPELLAEADARMLQTYSVGVYLMCIIKTLSGSGSGDRIQKDQG